MSELMTKGHNFGGHNIKLASIPNEPHTLLSWPPAANFVQVREGRQVEVGLA